MPAAPIKPTPRSERVWYLDAISALALFLVALLLTKTISRALGPLNALFFFAITAGMGWHFAKSSWRGLTGDRSNAGPR